MVTNFRTQRAPKALACVAGRRREGKGQNERERIEHASMEVPYHHALRAHVFSLFPPLPRRL